jgi:hypothetical protein
MYKKRHKIDRQRSLLNFEVLIKSFNIIIKMNQNQFFDGNSIMNYDFNEIESILNMDSLSNVQNKTKTDQSKRTYTEHQNHTNSKPKRQCLLELTLHSNNQNPLGQNSQETNLKQIRIEKRNQRERNRIKSMNQEFEKLADLLSNADFFQECDQTYGQENQIRNNNCVKRKKRQFSKLNILKSSIQYIQYLQNILNDQSLNDQSNFVEVKNFQDDLFFFYDTTYLF